MEQMAFILANVSTSLDSAPEVALTIASKEMGWLFARDVPKYNSNSAYMIIYYMM